MVATGAARRTRELRKYWIVALIIVVVAVAGVGIYEYQDRQKSTAVASGSSDPAAAATVQIPLYDDDHVLGSKDAPITMIEYASLTCPHCAHFHNDILPKIKSNYIDTGKV